MNSENNLRTKYLGSLDSCAGYEHLKCSRRWQLPMRAGIGVFSRREAAYAPRSGAARAQRSARRVSKPVNGICHKMGRPRHKKVREWQLPLKIENFKNLPKFDKRCTSMPLVVPTSRFWAKNQFCDNNGKNKVRKMAIAIENHKF